MCGEVARLVGWSEMVVVERRDWLCCMMKGGLARANESQCSGCWDPVNISHVAR